MFKPFAERSNEKLKEVLMHPEIAGPEVHYYMIRGGKDKTNITVWECGKVGDEYIKTYGHYHVGDISETYSIIQGEGILLLQKRKISDEWVNGGFFVLNKEFLKYLFELISKNIAIELIEELLKYNKANPLHNLSYYGY